MADEINNLLRYTQGGNANNFGPLTPEQEALMRLGITTETISPLDMLMGGGVGALLGRALGRGMGHAGGFIAGETGPAAANLAGRVGGGLGFLAGAGGPNRAAQDRARANTMMDAEGQPGGYYGDRKR
jgi:hypothetical protein